VIGGAHGLGVFGPAGGGGDARTARVLGERQTDFAELLNRELTRADAGSGSAEQRARSAAEDFVATALVEPLLKEVRAANDAPAPWGPSDVEKQFGGLIDADRARRLVRSGSFGIVDRLARDLLHAHGSVSRSQEVTDDRDG